MFMLYLLNSIQYHCHRICWHKYSQQRSICKHREDTDVLINEAIPIKNLKQQGSNIMCAIFALYTALTTMIWYRVWVLSSAFSTNVMQSYRWRSSYFAPWATLFKAFSVQYLTHPLTSDFLKGDHQQ